MNKSRIITETAAYVKTEMGGEASGHDWWHVYRVWQTAITICKYEPDADSFIVELGALLHDILDWKFANGDLDAGARKARLWLAKCQVSEMAIKHVEDIIRDTPYKGAGVKQDLKTIEAKIVFDADKLDAIGALGVARAFAYGGNKNREMYDPTHKPRQHKTFQEYQQQDDSHTINHFYEKLLLLKDRMQTVTGRSLAQNRHLYMEQFLLEFYAEWDGQK